MIHTTAVSSTNIKLIGLCNSWGYVVVKPQSNMERSAFRAATARANIKRRGAGRAISLLSAGSLLGGLAGIVAPALGAGAAGNLSIGVIAPFTGSQANLGPIIAAPCDAATYLINKNGGVLGHHLTCASIDDLGDAADAVPNVSKALATNSSLVAVSGIDSNVAATVVPIVNHANLPMFSSNGLSAFDKSTYKFFWRNTAPDLAGGAAMGIWAAQKKYKSVAMITQNDVGDTGNQPGCVKALNNAHVKITANVTIAGDASAYQSTLTRIIAGHPQALIISTDEQTIGTLLSEYKTLNSGKLPPVVTDTGIFDAGAFSAIKAAASVSYLTSQVAFIGTYVNTATPEFAAYNAAVQKAAKVSLPQVIVATGAVASLFDGINVMALAMIESHSTSGPTFNKDIPLIAAQQPGATIVHSFAQGVTALKAGHKIHYVGVTGPITFNKFHNSPGTFAGFSFTASQGSKTLGLISPATVAATIKGF